MTCLSWSRCGRYLASGAGDRAVALTDVAAGERVWASADLGAAPTHVSLLGGAPGESIVVVAFATGAPVTLPTRGAGGGVGTPVPVVPLDASASSPSSAPPIVAAAVADHARACIFVGQARGVVSAVDGVSGATLDIARLAGGGAPGCGPRVQSMTLSPCGGVLLAVCADRTVRAVRLADAAAFRAAAAEPAPTAAALADLGATATTSRAAGSLLRPQAPLLTPGREFAQAVDRPAWRAATASARGAFVAAAAASRDEHTAYVFDAATGEVDRVLSGPARDPVAAAAWHPRAPALATLGAATGRIYLWTPAFREDWAAFAPGFVELKENREYEEREDEFDANPRPDGGPGPGGVLPPPAVADGSGASGSVSFGEAGVVAPADASVTSGGAACLVRLPLEVWAEDGATSAAPMEEDGGGGGGGGGKRARE